MRRIYILLTLLIFATLHAVAGWTRAQAAERKVAAAIKKVHEVPARGPFKPVWEPLERMQVPRL